MNNRNVSMKMRIVHRYLGFFLAGIMAVYAISGIVLIFRNTDYFKNVTVIETTLATNLSAEEVGEALEIRRFKVEKEEGEVYIFRDGSYNKRTGEAKYTQKELPLLLDKMSHFHKSTSGEPLFFLNVFFGISLLFFVLSSFWMFMPSTSVFKKGLLFTLAGIVLTLILLFV